MSNLSPAAVDDKQGGVISCLPLLQLLNLLPQLILQSLPLFKPFAELLVLELNDLHVHLLLQRTIWGKITEVSIKSILSPKVFKVMTETYTTVPKFGACKICFKRN